MPSSKPWLEGPSPRDHAKAQAWQGAMILIMGGTFTAVTYFLLGVVWIWVLVAAICGLFWMLVGLVRLYTGLE